MLSSLEEGPAIQHLQGVVARCSRELEEHSRHFYKYKEEKDGMIDRVLVTRLFVSYVSKLKKGMGGRGVGSGRSGNSDERATSEEILTVIANMLEFDEADLIKVGLHDAPAADGSGRTTTSRHRSSSRSKRRGSRGGSSGAIVAGSQQQPQQSRKHRPPPPAGSSTTANVAYKNPFHEIDNEE